MNGWKIAGISILALLGLFFLGWAIQGNDYFMFSFWKPKYENVNRHIFENTESYVDGMNKELSSLHLQYKQAQTDLEKNAIKITIQSDFANFPSEKVNDYTLRAWLDEIKNE